jgi:O-antigen/teichoic acid export membrane protein
VSDPIDAGKQPLGAFRRVLQYGAVQASATLISSLCQLAFIVVLARLYPPTVVGAYGVALAYYALFSAFTGAGLTAILYRETAADLEEGTRLFHIVTAWRFRLCGLLILGSLPILYLTGGNPATFLCVVAGGATNYLSDPALSYLGGQLRILQVSVVTAAQRAIPLVLLLVALTWRSPALPGISYFVGAATTSFYIARAAGLHWNHLLAFDGQGIRKALRLSWPLAAASLGDALALRITTLLLGVFRGASAAGTYTPVANVAYGSAALAYSGFQPLIAVLGDRDSPFLSRRVRRATVGLFAGLLVAGGASQLFLADLYELLFDEDPSGTALDALRILVVGLVPWIMSVWFTIYMQVLRDYRATLLPSLVGTLSLIFIGIPLILRYGIAGAAMTSLLGDTLRMLWGARWFINQARKSQSP